MPLYDFESSNGVRIERFFKMQEVPPLIIVDNITYERVFAVPFVIMDLSRPKTLGDLARKNTERMQKRGNPKVQKKNKWSPFWRKDKKINFDLTRKTPQQQQKYIREGR